MQIQVTANLISVETLPPSTDSRLAEKGVGGKNIKSARGLRVSDFGPFLRLPRTYLGLP